MARLISEPVVVEWGDTATPLSFQWRQRQHRIAEVLADVREPDYHPNWRLRRHRRRLVVRTDDGRWFELYVQRPGHWILYREMDNPLV